MLPLPVQEPKQVCAALIQLSLMPRVIHRLEAGNRLPLGTCSSFSFFLFSFFFSKISFLCVALAVLELVL